MVFCTNINPSCPQWLQIIFEDIVGLRDSISLTPNRWGHLNHVQALLRINWVFGEGMYFIWKKNENRPNFDLNIFFTTRFFLHPDFNELKCQVREMNQMNLVDPTRTDK